MCGICGEYRLDGELANLEKVSVMNEVMVPRGPDSHGVWAQKNLAMGHRRLKIIDLSEKAQQPMIDNQLGLGIVYNGAIYNYQELRHELQQKGYLFFSEGDTEVILKAYHAWGMEGIKRLSGMFAFGIWERDTGKMILTRDRLGIKPLYYTKTLNYLRFASSLPALLATGEVDTELDPVALHHYMTFHSVVPAPFTLLKGVRKLPPASIMEISSDGKETLQHYWQLPFGPQTPEDETRGFEEWKDIVLTSLRTAVNRRLVADVPVGVLLSGGLDSSLIVGLLAEAGQKGLNTFSIGFESVGGEEGNEFKYSNVIVNEFNTEHHKIAVDSQRMLPSLKRCIASMSEPMVSHDNIGFYLLSEEVSKHVRVVQSGQGADEVFGGYHWYPPMMQSQDPVADYAQAFFDRDHDEYVCMIGRPWRKENFSLQYVHDAFAQPGAIAAIDQALRLDITTMLVDDPVKRVDNMTMAWGLEARVPFLDHDLVELAARIPGQFKIPNGGKYVLKETARSVIPAAVIDRPKGYFPVPALKYLRGDFLEMVNTVLNDDSARERQLVEPDYLDKLLSDPERHITPLRGSKLWQIALLESWLQTHNI
ncbi:MAG: N-acetylglutaminylglutamine amidotransferase [SAR324 cluster bacterium]|nr:N-acetylglutaminylglutamine amidotransferase [SAR324 cluster bacterium]